MPVTQGIVSPAGDIYALGTVSTCTSLACCQYLAQTDVQARTLGTCIRMDLSCPDLDYQTLFVLKFDSMLCLCTNNCQMYRHMHQNGLVMPCLDLKNQTLGVPKAGLHVCPHTDSCRVH